MTMNRPKTIRKLIYLIVLCLFLILTLGPILWTFVVSITPEYEMLSAHTGLLPDTFAFQNWIDIISLSTSESKVIFRGVKNSLITVFRTLVIGLPFVVITAFAFSNLEFRGRRIIKNIIFLTMVIPRLTFLIPLFQVFSDFGFLDHNAWISMVYVCTFLPLTTWLLTNYFETIPKSLKEAAIIDGCSQWKVLIKVILPLSTPILFSASLIIFMNTWAQFQIPLILATSSKSKPISVVASEFVTRDSIFYGLTAACGLIAIIPPAVMAVFFRKALVDGMVSGSVKE